MLAMQQAAIGGEEMSTVVLALSVARANEGRLEGTLAAANQTERIAFSGTLDLVRALEAAVDESGLTSSASAG